MSLKLYNYYFYLKQVLLNILFILCHLIFHLWPLHLASIYPWILSYVVFFLTKRLTFDFVPFYFLFRVTYPLKFIPSFISLLNNRFFTTKKEYDFFIIFSNKLILKFFVKHFSSIKLYVQNLSFATLSLILLNFLLNIFYI